MPKLRTYAGRILSTISVADDQGIRRLPKFVHADRPLDGTTGDGPPRIELFGSQDDEVP